MRVSYGATARLVFPFQLGGLPTGWTVSSASYVVAQGRLLGTGEFQPAPAGTRGR